MVADMRLSEKAHLPDDKKRFIDTWFLAVFGVPLPAVSNDDER